MSKSYPVNLPKTEFAQRANSAHREVELQALWRDLDVYAKNVARRKGRPQFVLHDGPPYASSPVIHIGTALNKLLKDFVVKYKTQRGFYAPFVPGYDTHGLPIENAALKEVKGGRAAVTPLELRRTCAALALTNLNGQQEQFQRLGVMADWDNRYLTMDKEFEAVQVRVFGELAQKGYVYKGLKPVHWCPNCETALAQADTEERDYTCPAMYLKFPVGASQRAKLPSFVPEDAQVSFAVWTTTPWSLPGNTALAVNAKLDYDFLVTPDHGVLVVASELCHHMCTTAGLGNTLVLGTVKGAELEHVVADHPFLLRKSPVVLSSHVLPSLGTGVVHIAPAFAADDYKVGREYKLATLCTVDERGVMTEEAGPFAGLRFEKANVAITEHLRASGKLLLSHAFTLKYPHCGRCDKPLLVRSTPQWFVNVTDLREEALAAVDTVQWLPEVGRNRIRGFVKERDDWCISRQRAWGVPIPVFDCTACGEHLMTADSVECVAKVFEKEGSDSWWMYDACHFLGGKFTCACGCKKFSKVMDTLDVWFDSGVSHAAVVDRLPQLLGSPYDLALEGSDQHRGWYQSQLWTSLMLKGRAPFRKVVTHGFVLDDKGEKQSKRKGNITTPGEVIQKYSADVLRLWVASVDYQEDMRIGAKMLDQLAEDYRKLRNTARYLLGNLHDFDPAADAVPLAELSGLDAYFLHRLNELVVEFARHFDRYEFHQVSELLQNFCVVEMSSLYLDVVKDRLYTHGVKSQSRRAVQTVLEHALQVLARLLVPFVPHLAEDIWQNMPEKVRLAHASEESVLLSDFPEWTSAFKNDALAAQWSELLAVRSVSNKALELARGEKKLGKPQEAQVKLYFDDHEMAARVRTLGADLGTLFLVSQATVVSGDAGDTAASDTTAELFAEAKDKGVRVLVFKADGVKCQRCWNFRHQVGSDARFPDTCQPCAAVLSEECQSVP